jgi:hypothetical protein
MVERALRLGVLDLDALIHHDIAAIETWDQATSTLEDGGCRDAGG